MLKRPALRVPSIALVAPEALDELQADLEWATVPLPFPVLEFEITGGAAKQTLSFHSDLDINFRTMDNAEARRLWREKAKQTSIALHRLRTLWDKWGVRLDIMLKFQDMRTVRDESFFGLKERKHYRPEMTTDTRGPRLPRPIPDWLAFDEEGNHVRRHDPFASEAKEAARQYGSNYQRY